MCMCVLFPFLSVILYADWQFFVAFDYWVRLCKIQRERVDTENGFSSLNEAFSPGNLIYKKRLIERNQILTNDFGIIGFCNLIRKS
jgi:hypothetical protein